jgi:hypothetical protein
MRFPLLAYCQRSLDMFYSGRIRVFSYLKLNGVYLSIAQRPFVISSKARNLVLLELRRFLVAGTPRNDRMEFLK